MQKKKIRNDIILAAVLLCAAAVILAIFFFTRSEGGYAVVLIDGEETARYPLSKDIEVTISAGEQNYNILKIEKGCADIIEASCPDGVCVEHRAIKYEGETIVCLPNKVVIRIDGECRNGGHVIS